MGVYDAWYEREEEKEKELKEIKTDIIDLKLRIVEVQKKLSDYIKDQQQHDD